MVAAMSKLLPGDRVRMKVLMISGWRGTGTVIEYDELSDTVEILKDGDEPGDYGRSHCLACRHEVAKIRQRAEA